MDAHDEHPFFMHLYWVANWLEREFTASASCPKSLLSGDVKNFVFLD